MKTETKQVAQRISNDKAQAFIAKQKKSNRQQRFQERTEALKNKNEPFPEQTVSGS